MRLKLIAILVLLVICIIAICMFFSGEGQQVFSAEQSVQSKSAADTRPAGEKAASQDSSPSEHVVAYYFHSDRRCRTCLTIEAYTEEALKEKFAEAITTGKLVWRSIDVSAPKNKHFVDDYQLYAQSVVLSAVREEKQTKWKNLDRVWQLVRNKQAFFSYVQTEMTDFMKE